MQFMPTHDNILVRRKVSESKTPGGIVIPQNAEEKLKEGEVLAVGPGIRDHGERVLCCVMPGDHIVWNLEENEVMVDGERLVLVVDCQVLGVIQE